MSSEQIKPEQPPEPTPGAPAAPRRQDEKSEKDEKDRREHHEKEEKWTRDPLSGIVWALIFISAGLLLLAQSVGIVNWDRIGGVWQPIFFAAGLILLLEVALRLVIPAYRRPILGTLILAFVLLAIGAGGIFNWATVWPIFLILAGLAILIGGLFRGRL